MSWKRASRSRLQLDEIKIAMPSSAISIAWSMIRKSGSRFFEKICPTKIVERQSIQSEAIALWSRTDGIGHIGAHARLNACRADQLLLFVVFSVFLELCLFVAKQFLDLRPPRWVGRHFEHCAVVLNVLLNDKALHDPLQGRNFLRWPLS
jgi:hypothetical protein